MINFFFRTIVVLLSLSATHAQSAITAYNNFLDAPQRYGQVPGFGYGGGSTAADPILGRTFIPTTSGNISDIWVGVSDVLSSVGTDVFHVYIATSGAQMEPDQVFASATVYGELSKRESVVHISTSAPDIFIQQGTMYWMLIAQDTGTFGLAWLGGSSTPGGYSAYLDPTSSTGWYIAPFNGNGAMRVDVTPVVVPLPAALWLLGSGLLGLVGAARRSKSH